MTRSHRRGTGIALFLCLLVLAAVFPVLLARHSQGSRTRAAVKQATATVALLSTARSALAEAWWELERRSATVADPVFRALRFPGGADRAPALAVPRLAAALASDPSLSTLEVVDGVRVDVDRAHTVATDGELEARVTLRATVRHRAAGLTRQLAETRTLRVALVGVPPPLDQFSVAVLDAANLVPAPANGWMDDAARGLTQIATLSRELVQSPDTAAVAAPLAAIEAQAPIGDDLAQPLHHFPGRYAIGSQQRHVASLADLDLVPRLTAAHQRVAQADAAMRAGAASDADVIARILELANADRALLDLVRAYQAGWLEYGDAAADWLWSFTPLLDRTQWAARAQFHFGGPGAVTRFTRLLDRLAAEDPPRGLNGVVYLDNAGEPLRLTGRSVRGRLALLATGAVELEDVRLADRSTDKLVVQAEGNLQISGKVEGYLVAHGPLTVQPLASITGGLLVQHLEDPAKVAGGADGEPERFDCSLEGTENPSFFQVSLSPWAVARALDGAR